ncbi:AMP-binding protein [Oligoflexus tunisiensis]|uniref:AMP-binding protein n=1 Tax=Oligoflexus tunisiensis TaxID=708132 RepID=UPI000AE7E64C|nr:AMP-binding protein [Oligoflexus tunisiensis]
MSEPMLKTPLDMFHEREKNHPNRVFLRQPLNGQWHEYTWGEAGRQARRMAQVLHDLGCQKGDRVAILSKNCAHWIMADLAIMMAGCVSVPLYPTQQADSIEYVLQHSETKVIFVGKLDEGPKMEPGIPASVKRIRFPYPDPMQAEHDWKELVENGPGLTGQYRPDPDDLASIIYTSGTTGFPKGVMHSFRTIAHAAMGYRQTFDCSPEDRFFSYLPLSHVAERVLVEMNGIYCGATISFAESLDTFAQNLRDVAPTAFFSVPRLWKKFQQGILEKVPQEKLDRLLAIPVVSGLIKRKIRKGLGLHKCRSIGSGAAPIAPSLQAWYQKIGIDILEGYGLTENFAYATANRIGKNRIGTVGAAQPHTEVNIAENGEIWIKNKAAMLGYYKDPASTAEVLFDGAIRTGDMGEIDADGCLKITGRIKEIFKTDTGKYVAPAPIENHFLADNPYIEQLCITGNTLPSPVALCVLTESARKQPQELILKEFSESLLRLNKKLDKHERINRCILIHEDWTVDGGMMTPTLKVKRHQVEAKYRHVISKAMLADQPIVYEHHLPQ